MSNRLKHLLGWCALSFAIGCAVVQLLGLMLTAVERLQEDEPAGDQVEDEQTRGYLADVERAEEYHHGWVAGFHEGRAAK